jgi:methyl-accepting chemotaxis protein
MDAKDKFLDTKGLVYFETTVFVLAMVLYLIFYIFHKAEAREREIGEEIKIRNEQLTELLEKMRQAANSINNLTSDIQELSGNLSQNASRQAVATEESAQAIEEFQAIFNQIVANVKKTLELANQASSVFADNKNAFEKTQAAIIEIQQRIEYIQKIASKSDILAINASIEAKKYGDQAKGFSVIAHEIRNLAEQTTAYGEQIKDAVSKHFELSKKTLIALNRFMKEFQNLIDAVKDINTNVLSQVKIIEQINSSVTEVNQTAQNTASAAEQLKQAIVQLKQVVESLASA